MLRNLTAALLIPLLLLPSFTFLVPLSSTVTPPTTTGRSPGHSLPPGNVTSSTYSQIPLKCPVSVVGSQPLLPNSGTWSISLKIPYSTFNGLANNAFLTQYFTVYQNGTFLAFDDKGNRFEIGAPTLGLAGSATTGLKSNSTTAVQTTLLTLGSRTIADVTLTFSVYDFACQPAGVRVVASGEASWGAAVKGTFSLPFKTKPTSVSGYTAWFGQVSGSNATSADREQPRNAAQALGFDWSDSKGLSPAYNSVTDSLSWSVGNSFLIDPVTVSSTTSSNPISYGYEGHICFAESLYWVFYYSGASEAYRTSADYGNTWSSEKTISVSHAGPWSVSFACSGNTVAYASTDANHKFYYRWGTMTNGSLINWNMTAEAYRTASYYQTATPHLVFDSKNNLWVKVDTCSTVYDDCTLYVEVWEGTGCGTTGCTWTRRTLVTNGLMGVLVSLTVGKLALIYQTTTLSTTYAKFWTGSAWTSSGSTSNGYDLESSGYSALGDKVVVGFNKPSTSTQGYVSIPYSTSPVWGSPVTIESDTGGTASIAGDNLTTLVLYIGHSLTVNEYTSQNSGATWSNATAISSNETSSVSNLDALPLFYGNSSVVWAAGNTVRFQDPGGPVAGVWASQEVSPPTTYPGNIQAQVSPNTGLLELSQNYLNLPGWGMDLAITGVFSEPFAFTKDQWGSLYPYRYEMSNMAPMGQGWSLDFPWIGKCALHLYGQKAIPYPSNYTMTNGCSVLGLGTLRYHEGTTDFNLTRQSDGTYTLVLNDGRVYYFGSWPYGGTPKLYSIYDRGGDSISFGWASDCPGTTEVTSITDTDNRVATLSYYCHGVGGTLPTLHSIAYENRIWTFGYEPVSSGLTTAYELANMTDPLGMVTNFTYDTTKSLITQVVYPTGAFSSFTYISKHFGTGTGYWRELANSENDYPSSGSGYRTESISYGLKTKTGAVERATDTFSDQTSNRATLRYSFASSGMTRSVGKLSSLNAILGPEDRIVRILAGGPHSESRMSYDNWGNVVRSKDYIQADTNTMTYHEYANTNSGAPNSPWPATMCPTSNFFSNSVNPNVFNAVTGVCSNSGKVQQYFQYDSQGFLTRSKRLDNANGTSTTVWLNTIYSYTGPLLMSVLDSATGRSIYYSYDSYGVLESQTGGDSYTYDSNGFVTGMTDQGGNHFTFSNDADGRVKQVWDPDGTVYIAYPGNKVEIQDENGDNTTEVYDGLGRLLNVSGSLNSENYTYNWLNEVVVDRVPSGWTYNISYDAMGRLTKVQNPDNTYRTLSYSTLSNMVTAIDEKGHRVDYTYNWNGWLTKVSTSHGSATYGYDAVGHLTSATVANQITNYYYDDVGNLYKIVYPDGVTTDTAAFDGDGNMVMRVSPNGITTTYAHDNLNRLTAITCEDSTLTYGYDGYGHVTNSSGNGFATLSRTYNWRGELTYEEAGGLSTAYSYDSAGNLRSIQYPDTSTVSMTYDAQDRLKTVGSYVTNIVYGQGNDPTTFSLGNGGTLSLGYDSRDRLTSANGVSYGLDAVGNVGVNGYNGATYNYDALNRLTGSTGGLSTSYSYDSAGNLQSKTENGVTTSFAYPSPNYFNELQSKTVGGVTTSYTYDNDGNMVTKNAGGIAWAFNYNYLDQMTNVTKSGQTVETNTFDGLGRRISRTMGSVTTTYAYIGDKILYEYNSTGTSIKHFYADGFQVAEVANGVTYYPVQNYVGSTVQVKDSSLATVFSASYYPWGKAAVNVNTHPESLKFTEMPYDSATGLYFFGTRFYDPTIGRFVQMDSSPGRMTDPLGLNKYAYAGDNPMTFNDNSGMAWWNDWWNDLSPTEQGAIVVTGLVVLTAVTAGLTAPTIAGALVDTGVVGGFEGAVEVTGVITDAAVGAGFNAGADLTLGLYEGNASPESVLTAAGTGAFGGGFSAVAKVSWPFAWSIPAASKFLAGQAGVGFATSFVSQEASSYERIGNAAPLSSGFGGRLLLGGLFGMGGGLADAGAGGNFGEGARVSVLSTGATTIAQLVFNAETGIRFQGWMW